MFETARALGGSELAVGLTEQQCVYLLALAARDLGHLAKLNTVSEDFGEFFESGLSTAFFSERLAPESLFESLLRVEPDADTYFFCLATLYKSRLKYARILECQPIPTMEQIGPRALLQYGTMSPSMLAGFMLWRKWFYDIDNRAGQETGYLFEPIIAHAIGGASASTRDSPVIRHNNPSRRRQVDCIRGDSAYEIKIRVTIAASGQGRWREELDFPLDCQKSGFRPILIVLDSTPNAKLSELQQAFLTHGGAVYVGEAAWTHLESVAGQAMAVFLEKYVRRPIDDVLSATPDALPKITFQMDETSLTIETGRDRFCSPRQAMQ